MANEEQLAILRRGVEVWNRWREENSEIKIDLTGADLQGTRLSEANLKQAELNQANLKGTVLNGANLMEARLIGTNLSEANLRKVDLRRAKLAFADLSKADLSGVWLISAEITNANLVGANLSSANLTGANGSNANLTGVIFWRADLSAANLNSAKLEGALFNNARLNGANLDASILINADLTGARLPWAKLRGANLRKAILDHADLTASDLMGADLSEANLTGANLNGAELSEALLNAAHLDGADLRGANLIRCNFSGAVVFNTIFGNSDLSEVLGWDRVIHLGPSSISIDAFTLSKGRLPEIFLRGCGLSDWEIESVKLYTPDLSNDEFIDIQNRIFSLRQRQALQISSLFISYSHADSVFVDKLEEHLNDKGIRFWRDVHDAKAGRLEKQIDRAMRLNPTVLLILSEHSLKSDWVEHEVRTARELEKEMEHDVLCPVALDDSWKKSPWPKRVMEQIMVYNILDFSAWKDDSKFGNTFNKLIDGLELFYKK